jgi:hypothetical protein
VEIAVRMVLKGCLRDLSGVDELKKAKRGEEKMTRGETVVERETRGGDGGQCKECRR